MLVMEKRLKPQKIYETSTGERVLLHMTDEGSLLVAVTGSFSEENLTLRVWSHLHQRGIPMTRDGTIHLESLPSKNPKVYDLVDGCRNDRIEGKAIYHSTRHLLNQESILDGWN